ncbi:MAG: LytTR family DNA-binding domain-containing protein [Pseudomonadota bacterium]
MTLDQYEQHRRLWEIGLWTAFFVVNWLAGTWVEWLEFQREGNTTPLWQPLLWEGSSNLTQLLLLPLILLWDRRFPLEPGQLRRNAVAHAGFSVVFSLLHVVSMVAIRKAVYVLKGTSYDFGHWPSELLYEYLKDFRSYAYFLGVLYLYRFILRRLRGEAGFLSEENERDAPRPVTDRFLVKKLGREFLVKVDDIEWIEAAGNYVNLNVGSRAYPLRETMTNISSRLADAGFLRVHRSAIVNLDQVAQIVPFDTGDGEAHLQNGTRVPVSRRYRKALRERLQASSDGRS